MYVLSQLRANSDNTDHFSLVFGELLKYRTVKKDENRDLAHKI